MKQVFLAIVVSTLVACGGGGGGGGKNHVDPVVDCSPTDDGNEGGIFISWLNSANGAYVVDSDEDFARVESVYPHIIELNGLFYPDITVDPNGGQIFINGIAFDAKVHYVLSEVGCRITGITNSEGRMYNLIQYPDGSLDAVLSDKFAIAAKATGEKDTGIPSYGEGKPGITNEVENKGFSAQGFTAQGVPAE